MVVVDTSVWIEFLRKGNKTLEALLQNAEVATHPLIIVELACGSLKDRTVFISLLNDLPQCLEADHMEVLSFIENNHLYSKGVGITDMQILSSTIISNYKIWTNDKRLKSISAQFNCLF